MIPCERTMITIVPMKT